MPSKDKTTDLAKPAMLALGVSLTFFWILNILKEAYAPVKNFLGFYPSVGPLLGLFLGSIVVFGIALALINSQKLDKRLDDKTTLIIYMVTVLLFFVMVFPPFFEPLVNLLAGK